LRPPGTPGPAQGFQVFAARRVVRESRSGPPHLRGNLSPQVKGGGGPAREQPRTQSGHFVRRPRGGGPPPGGPRSFPRGIGQDSRGVEKAPGVYQGAQPRADPLGGPIPEKAFGFGGRGRPSYSGQGGVGPVVAGSGGPALGPCTGWARNIPRGPKKPVKVQKASEATACDPPPRPRGGRDGGRSANRRARKPQHIGTRGRG